MTNTPLRADSAVENPHITPAVSADEWQAAIESERAAWARFDELPDDYADEECNAVTSAWSPTLTHLLTLPVDNAPAIRVKVGLLKSRGAIEWTEVASLLDHLMADLDRAATHEA